MAARYLQSRPQSGCRIDGLAWLKQTNQGCIFEIQQLVAWVKLEQVEVVPENWTGS
jgi:hypothetical protein